MKRFYKAMALVSLLGISNFSCRAADDAKATRYKEWLVSKLPFFATSHGDDKEEFLDALGRGHNYEKILSLAQERGVNTPFENGSTPLHLATECGCVGAVCTLLLNKANINAINQDGQTPLHIAATRGYTEVAHMLLTFYANARMIVNARTRDGYTPYNTTK
jgi:ankyrin repeat protein